MVTKRKLSVLGIAVASAMAFTVTSVHAATVTNLLVPGIVNTAHDVDLEYISHQPPAATADTLAVGSVITGYLDFSNFLNPGGQALGLNSGNDQLTAFFDVQVTSETPAGGGTFNLTFGPDTSGQTFKNGVLDPTGTTFQAQYGTGAMVAVYTANSAQTNYLTSTLDATKTQTVAGAGVTAGSLYWVLGFSNPGTANTGTTGEGWGANGPLLFNFQADPTGLILSQANFAVNLLPSSGIGNTVPITKTVIGPGVALFTNTLAGSSVDFVGSSTIRGTGGSTLYNATSDSDLNFAVSPAPLPAALPTGLAMLGALAAVRLVRRRKVAVA